MNEEINIEKENFINRKKEENGQYEDENKKWGLAKLFSTHKSVNIVDEFFKDFFQKYKKIEFLEIEDIDAIKNDLQTIIEYDYDVSEKRDFYYMGEFEIKEIYRTKINNKEAFISEREYTDTTNDISTTYRYFNLFMKLNLDKRFHIKTDRNLFKKDYESYENNFLDAKDYLIEYDLKNSKELESALSEEFYFQKFSVNSEVSLLELDNIVKQKLLDIYNKYNIKFYIGLKDNLLRLEIELPTDIFRAGYGLLYEIEKTFEEILAILLELERVNDNIRLNNVPYDYLNVKNLIFDVDNTIIFDTEEDSEYYREALINAGFSDDYFYGIYQVIDDYDKAITEENPYYNEQDMLDFINESLEQNFSIEVIERIKEVAGREWIKRILVSEETLEYLASKYNLYIYSNYFQEVQIERLKNIDYLKYFKGVFGADKYGCKQYKKCFEKVLAEIKVKPEECLMIGDDKSKDIIAANNVNMKSILFDYNGRRDKKEIDVKDYFIIKDMNELKRIL